MRRTILSTLLIFTAAFLLSPATFATCVTVEGVRAAEGFSVREYEEFHDVLHPLQHEALPNGDFKRIRAEANELVKRGEAILKLGVPAGVTEQNVKEFREELKRFGDALAKFKTDADTGTDAQLKESYSAVHDSFEMLAALLPRVKR
jgi:hypothetical protein